MDLELLWAGLMHDNASSTPDGAVPGTVRTPCCVRARVCVFRKLASCCFHFLALFLYSGCLGLWLYVPEPEQPLDEWGCGLTFLSEMMACT